MSRIFTFIIKCIFLTVTIFTLTLLNDLYTHQEIKPNIKKKIKVTEKKDKLSNITEKTVNKGIGKWVGKTSNELQSELGEPDRIDISYMSFSWWVYTNNLQSYYQFTINDQGIILAATALGKGANVAPFQIGQENQEILQELTVLNELDIEIGDKYYQLELTENSMSTTPITAIDNLYIQLFFDFFEGELMAVRFVEPELLFYLESQSDELDYYYDLKKIYLPEDTEKQRVIEEGLEKQVYELVNLIRNNYNLQSLLYDDNVAQVARNHSLDMYENNYFAHEAQDGTTPSGRMDAASIGYNYLGENIAFGSNDAITIVQGWMNSFHHREIILNDTFRTTGIGVHQKYYTQNFLTFD